MSRSYRIVFVALVGWLILTGANKSSSAATKENHEEIDRQRRTNENNAAQTIASAIRETITPIEKDRGCNSHKENRDSDLCAQWKAADSARDAAEYAFWTLVVSAFGTGLLIWTLWETRQTARRQLRAYMVADKVTPEIGQEEFTVRICWLNCGETPAHNVQVTIWIDISEAPDFGKLPKPEEASLYIGAGKGFKSSWSIKAGEFAAKGQNASVWLYARISYQDIFKKKRKTDVCLEYDGARSFRAAPSNNIAT